MIPFTNEFVMLDVRPVILTGVGILNALERALFVNGTSKTKWDCRNDAAPVTCYYITITNIYSLLPLDGVGSAVPSLQLHPVFGIDTERVPPNDAMSRFVGFGDKSWDNLKNFFQTQGFEFLFLSQSARRVAFGGSMAPKTPVLKLNRPFARKPPAAIASELTRVACAPFAKPQVAGLRHS